MSTENILIIGANGQIGIELAEALRKIYGDSHVITSDLRPLPNQIGIFEELYVMNKNRFLEIVKKYQITQEYLLAALLSPTAEKNPRLAWDLNMEG